MKSETINIKRFLEEKQLFFKTEKQEISWVKRNLKPTIFIKAGPNYLVNPDEIDKLFQDYLQKQAQTYKEKVERVKQLREKKINNLKND